MNNLGDSNLKEKYLLGLKTVGFFYCVVSVMLDDIGTDKEVQYQESYL